MDAMDEDEGRYDGGGGLVGGILLHRSRLDDLAVEVVEVEGRRLLRFGSLLQSAMRLDVPHELELIYTRAMMGGLLLVPRPLKVLIIGLGGGSLVKFLLHYLPENAVVDVVEVSPRVVALAKRFFMVPEDPRLTIWEADGAAFLNRAKGPRFRQYQMILVDAFDAAGMARSVYVGGRFFQRCRQRLAPEGVVAVNLLRSSSLAYQNAWAAMEMGLSLPLWRLPVPGTTNLIVFSGPMPVLRRKDEMALRLAQIRETYGLDLSRHLESLLASNLPWWRRWFGF